MINLLTHGALSVAYVQDNAFDPFEYLILLEYAAFSVYMFFMREESNQVTRSNRGTLRLPKSDAARR